MCILTVSVFQSVTKSHFFQKIPKKARNYKCAYSWKMTSARRRFPWLKAFIILQKTYHSTLHPLPNSPPKFSPHSPSSIPSANFVSRMSQFVTKGCVPNDSVCETMKESCYQSASIFEEISCASIFNVI